MSHSDKLSTGNPQTPGKVFVEDQTVGELIVEVTAGTNLIDGKQTWEHAKESKNDIGCMKRCCDAELKTMKEVGVVAAPYYFERVAILSRKEKNYSQEVDYCEAYIAAVESYYENKISKGAADVRKGPRYQSIVKRSPKAKALLSASADDE